MSAAEDFRPVTRDEPCVICGKGNWCRRSRDGAHECHRKTEESINGFTRLAITPAGFAVYRSAAADRESAHSSLSPGRAKIPLAQADFSADDRKFRAVLPAERKAALAKKIGVSVAALDAVGIGEAHQDDLKRLRASGAGWREDYPAAAFSFSECDATGAVIGFCFRTWDGRKGSPSGKVGGKRGLIIPSTLATRPDPVLLVEGPTDVAACETLGIASVGRPSNVSGGKFISQLLARREVLVVGENDQNPAGTWPGREGAEKLAQQLALAWKRPVKWTLPPVGFKDARAYLQQLIKNGFESCNQ